MEVYKAKDENSTQSILPTSTLQGKLLPVVPLWILPEAVCVRLQTHVHRQLIKKGIILYMQFIFYIKNKIKKTLCDRYLKKFLKIQRSQKKTAAHNLIPEITTIDPSITVIDKNVSLFSFIFFFSPFKIHQNDSMSYTCE